MTDSNPVALRILGLSKTFDDHTVALRDIDLAVVPGEFFALLGPNGAGKSTTIGIITSLIKKTAGQVQVFGEDIDDDFSSVKQKLGVVPQEFNFNQFEQVFDIVVNQAGYYGMPRAEAVKRAKPILEQLGLWDKRNTTSRYLSGGMKRRLMIARALIHDPKLLILDEPTAGVDIELRRSMWDFLRKINAQGTTIILTTHYLEEAESLCRQVAIINHGEIIENTSVKSLLKKLNKEVFVMDTQDTVSELPETPNYLVRQIDGTTLEVEVEKGQSLNRLFDILSQNQIQVVSMRNKVNRLEELFVSMVQNHETPSVNESKRGQA